MTYGYQRTGILAALLNAASLLVIAVIICWEAYGRFFSPEEVKSTSMLIVASVGFLANLYVVLGMRTKRILT